MMNNNKEPDRVPVDLGGTKQSSICKNAYVDLMKYLKIDFDKNNVEILNMVQQQPAVDRRCLERINACAIPVFANPPSDWKLEIKE